ncbi:MAG: DUF4406 domain-containing protein [Prevotella sp.]|nr:DUF4406 domain-containing protein [Prevotella sp.]
MNNKRVYISLPIGEDKEVQKKQEAFSWDVVKKLAKRGCIGVNPFRNGLRRDAPRTAHLREDFKMLLSCDMLLLCPGYENSDGCQKELSVAVWAGIEVVRYKDFFE